VLGYQAQYPYGVEYTTTANDREKYATYTRDSDSGMDYAMNRYYSSQWGRFLSPDPNGGSIDLSAPQSWNRYTYVGGDPDGNDPSGLYIGPPGRGDDGGWSGGGEGWGTNPGGGGGFGFDGPFGCNPPEFYDFLVDGIIIPGLSGSCGQGSLPSIGNFGGGGGVNNNWASALFKASAAAQYILDKTSWSPDCIKDLAGVDATVSELQQAAGAADFENGTTSNAKQASLYQGAAAQAGNSINPNLTVSQFFESTPTMGAEAALNGNQIYIRPSYFNYLGSGYAISVVAHELLHNLTGMGDDSLQSGLGLPTNQPSNNVTMKLFQDCFP
jgi:RHS repeat-associated protein